MTPDRYMREIVEPTIKDLKANPASQRHAFIACVVAFHTIDHLAGTPRKAGLRAEYRRQSPAFAAIDRIAHAGERERAAAATSERADVVALVDAAATFLRSKIRASAAPPAEPTNEAYYVVVPFDRNAEGELRAGAPQEAMNAAAARRRARSLAAAHAGAIAFSRCGDPLTGEFEDAAILARFGEVDLGALGGG